MDSLLHKYHRKEGYEQAGASIVVFEKALDAKDIHAIYSHSLVQKVKRLV